MCESSMSFDVESVVKTADLYIEHLGPEDVDAADQSRLNRKVVLSSFDNSSNMPGPDSNYVDDPRWTMELTRRVTEKLKEEGRNISADKRDIIHAAIKRRSRFSRRTFYDYRGIGSPDIGDLNTVFSFSGRA